MARGKARTPDEQMAELQQKRVGLAGKRHEADNVANAATAVLEGIPDRRRAAVNAELDGDKGAETVDQVDHERGAAETALAEARERADVIQQKEREIGDEVEAVIDANPAHFVKQAEAASEEAQQAIVAATEATQAAVTSWRAAYSAWSLVRMSRSRRGLDLTPQVPVNDLGSAVNELQKAQPTPFPGGSREAWSRFLEREAAERALLGKKTSLTRSEALAQFAGEQ